MQQVKRFRRKYCKFCADKVELIDYKDASILRGFITDKGKIMSRRMTGNCSKHQRMLTRAIKRARSIALLSPTER
ncbi:MAG: 30S ribosomal protein S18 [Nitrospirae bacterium]|nr:MAG: 30S ribosomal protein S18 [Nitrospirota bacterium]